LDNAVTAIATVACIKRAGDPFRNITLGSIARGLEAVRLPGRFQIGRLVTPPHHSDTDDKQTSDFDSSHGSHLVSTMSLHDDHAPPTLVVLDGAHTPESAAALARTVRATFPDAAIALVVAMAGDKDHQGVCAALQAMRPMVVVFTEVSIAGGTTRSAPPGVLVAAWQAAGMAATATATGSAGGGGEAPGSKGHRRSRELIQASLTAAVAKAEMELRAAQGRSGVIVVCGSLHTVGTALQQLSPLQVEF